MAQIKTVRKIAERMGWSPATVLRRHKLDNFPLYPDWTKRGLIWVTSDELILKWEEGKVRMSHGARLRQPPRPRHKPTYRPYNWRLRYKNETGNETVGPTRIEGESRSPLHEESQLQFSKTSRCEVHLQGEAAVPSLQEELAKLGPVERAWVINHELTPAQLEELGIKLPETPKRKCTCGTEIPCTAHD
jgi:hypothetical protein